MRQPPTMTGCREYMGYRDKGGYGCKQFKGRVIYVHRWVWEQINGPIPKGMIVMHRCDNPACFLYAHLRLGTQAENIADAAAKGRQHIGVRRDLCQYGHPIITRASGRRECKTCKDAWARSDRERRRNN